MAEAPSIKTAATLLAAGGMGAMRVSPDAFKIGMTVEHPELGVGTVLTLSGSGKGRRAAVVFEEHGEKRFVLAFSPLRPLGT